MVLVKRVNISNKYHALQFCVKNQRWRGMKRESVWEITHRSNMVCHNGEICLRGFLRTQNQEKRGGTWLSILVMIVFLEVLCATEGWSADEVDKL